MQRLTSLAFVIALSLGAGGAPRTEAESRLLAHFGDVPVENRDRHGRLRQLFREVGCTEPELTEPVVEGSSLPNVVCTLPGAADETVIVGAHFDRAGEGQGVADNWSGSCLLPALFASLAARDRHHTFVFIGFTDEELGLVGSKAYVAALTPEQRAGIRAMVNLDTLG